MQKWLQLLRRDNASEEEDADASKALEKGSFPRGHIMVPEYQRHCGDNHKILYEVTPRFLFPTGEAGHQVH